MPKSLEEFARWRVRTGGYGSISEYFRELVRVDQRFIVAKQEQKQQ
jgi:Arc/MetJ-type ribon-helix-helix transcriptional regulator